MGDSITFEQWAEYVFRHGYRQFMGDDYLRLVHGRQSLAEGSPPFPELDTDTVGRFMVRLFRDPEWVADAYTPDEISDGVWFLFGIPSEYLHNLYYGGQRDLLKEVLVAVGTLYTELFDRVCTDEGGTEVDVAVYMIFDNSSGVAADDHDIMNINITTLETALFRCRTLSCQASALHGLNHLVEAHDLGGLDHDLVPQRAIPLIDRYLSRQDLPDELRELAERARRGELQ